ncbi:MAG: sensor histidine kinase [Trichloromonadaceae bacterium]
MFQSLVSRVIILTILLLTLVIGIFSLFHIRREQNHLLSATRESAELLLTTIERSIFNSMRVGNSDEVQAILEMIGKSHRLEGVRIFHPDGTVLKSSRPEELGRQIDLETLALFQNRRSVGVFPINGTDILAMVRPIISDDRCGNCHGLSPQLVGVLNANYSLVDTNLKLRESTRFFLLSTLVILAVLAVGVSFILLRFVRRPLQEMADKMAQVEAGDLSVRLPQAGQDEVGSLMGSFNSMVGHLEAARSELELCHFGQMARADRLASVGEMASGIAHEIKNPLAGISGAISVLAEDFDPEDPRREIIRQVLEQIGRLDKTAADLLSFGRPSKPELSYVDVNTLVKNTLFFVSQHPEAVGIHRLNELTRDLPPVWVDEKQLQQVLFNIIINAIQAMKGSGTLTVQTESPLLDGRRFVRVAVSDTGGGIPEAEIEKIFIPFHTTKTQGTGLGLAICRQLLEQNGGTIQVVNQPGLGATFLIDIPVRAGAPEAEKEGQRAQI